MNHSNHLHEAKPSFRPGFRVAFKTGVSGGQQLRRGSMKQHVLPTALGALMSATLALSATVRAETLVLEHVTLIDGTHAPQADMTVAVEGNHIAAVTPSELAHGREGRRIGGHGKDLI